ncbi:hypothetical protein [uncultured Desulfovibrio sp.]|uniref:hypothetical protein n=1 Tax=uncultured Desulfovibrio sp. TaxID=167968 RepID=UPI00345B87D2
MPIRPTNTSRAAASAITRHAGRRQGSAQPDHVVYECWRVARAGAPLMVFTDWRQLPALTDAVQGAGWKWLGIVPWNKRSARPQIGRFRQQCEHVLCACKGSLTLATRSCLPGLYSCPRHRQAEGASDKQARGPHP